MAWHVQFFLRSSGVLFCGVLLCSLFLVFSFCGLRSVSNCSAGLVKKLHFSWTTLMWGQRLCLDPHSKPTFLHSRYSVQFIRNLRQTTCKDWSWCFVHKLHDCAPPKKFELIGVKLKLRRLKKKKSNVSPPLFSVNSRCKIPEIVGLALAFVYNFIYLLIFRLRFKVVDFVCLMSRLKRTPYEFYWLNFSTHKQCSSLVKVSRHWWIGQASLMTCSACGICQPGEVN